MRLIEEDTPFDFLQEEVISLSKDVVDLDEKVDEVLDNEINICQNCIKICNLVDEEHDRITRLRNHVFELEDTVESWLSMHRIILVVLVILMLVRNALLTYFVCHGL